MNKTVKSPITERADDIRLAISRTICMTGLRLNIRIAMCKLLCRIDQGLPITNPEHIEIIESLLSVSDQTQDE